MTIFQGIHPFDNEHGCGSNGNHLGGGMDFNSLRDFSIGDQTMYGDGHGEGTIAYHIDLISHRQWQMRNWN